jgi:hypothetical protein
MMMFRAWEVVNSRRRAYQQIAPAVLAPDPHAAARRVAMQSARKRAEDGLGLVVVVHAGDQPDVQLNRPSRASDCRKCSIRSAGISPTVVPVQAADGGYPCRSVDGHLGEVSSSGTSASPMRTMPVASPTASTNAVQRDAQVLDRVMRVVEVALSFHRYVDKPWRAGW